NNIIIFKFQISALFYTLQLSIHSQTSFFSLHLHKNLELIYSCIFLKKMNVKSKTSRTSFINSTASFLRLLVVE
ncbi:hypothetical protein M5D96_002251, partial [Drosophila gunungcola]